MKNDYKELDALIVEAARCKINPLYDRGTRAEAERLVLGTKREPFRVVDARLQALRKRGVIKFTRGSGAHWALVKSED